MFLQEEATFFVRFARPGVKQNDFPYIRRNTLRYCALRGYSPTTP